MAKKRRKVPTRPPPPELRHSGRAGDRRLLAAFAVVVFVSLALTAFQLARHRGSRGTATAPGLTASQRSERAAALAFRSRVTDAFKPIAGSLSTFVGDTQHWATGALGDGEYRTHVVSDLLAFVESRDAVKALPAFSINGRANDLYRQSSLLYEQSARVALAAADTPAGDLRTQIRLTGQRLRELGDRVFDRAGVIVVSAIHEAANPNLVINLPEEVPIWPAEALAAGPPLDAGVDVGPVGVPPQHQAVRPQQSRARWRAAVTTLALPSATNVAKSITSGSADDLGHQARRLTAAVESLRRTPDPVGDREGATVVRLGLLVDAEAARAAQASRLLPTAVDHDALKLVAERLALVSDHLWASDLPPRHSGFADSLLHARA